MHLKFLILFGQCYHMGRFVSVWATFNIIIPDDFAEIGSFLVTGTFILTKLDNWAIGFHLGYFCPKTFKQQIQLYNNLI